MTWTSARKYALFLLVAVFFGIVMYLALIPIVAPLSPETDPTPTNDDASNALENDPSPWVWTTARSERSRRLDAV